MTHSWPLSSWLKLAVIRYGLSPSEFWNMSVHDWRVLTQSTDPAPLQRAEFAALAQAYPDTKKETT